MIPVNAAVASGDVEGELRYKPNDVNIWNVRKNIDIVRDVPNGFHIVVETRLQQKAEFNLDILYYVGTVSNLIFFSNATNIRRVLKQKNASVHLTSETTWILQDIDIVVDGISDIQCITSKIYENNQTEYIQFKYNAK